VRGSDRQSLSSAGARQSCGRYRKRNGVGGTKVL
jgi:hypothetical protein